MTLGHDRQNAIAKAIELYVDTGEETNISVAFERYLKEHPEEDFPAIITRADKKWQPTLIAEEDRPKCPVCDMPMGLGSVNTDPTNMVGGDYKTQWVCQNEVECGYQEDYSTLTIEEQMAKYRKE